MCIVALAWQVVPDKPLVLLGNRDESYHREAAPLSLWQDNTIIAGRDLQSGGSWLGITTAGRWAVITNYREKSPPSDLTTSRSLVKFKALKPLTKRRTLGHPVLSNALLRP